MIVRKTATAQDVLDLPEGAGIQLVARHSNGLADMAGEIAAILAQTRTRPNLRLRTRDLLRALRALRGEAVHAQLCWSDRVEGGIRDDELAGLGAQLEAATAVLIAKAEGLDPIACERGDWMEIAELVLLDRMIERLRAWLGAPPR